MDYYKYILFRKNNEVSVVTKDCSMFSDFQEILEWPIDIKTNNDGILAAVTERVDRLKNDVVKKNKKRKEKLTRNRSINRNN